MTVHNFEYKEVVQARSIQNLSGIHETRKKLARFENREIEPRSSVVQEELTS